MKGLLLISGGFDSPVAGWLMKERMELEAVHFSNNLFAGTEPEAKVMKLCEILGINKVHVIDVSQELHNISQKGGKYYFVLMKRMFMKRAEVLAKERGCSVLITGESLAQVSSQTIENLAAIDQSTSIPILRPLLAWEKQQIIDFAKKIDTHDTSVGPEHCDALGPDMVATRARIEKVLELERLLG